MFQFDWNDHVRTEVEDLAIDILRNEPVGRDVDGQIYWTQVSMGQIIFVSIFFSFRLTRQQTSEFTQRTTSSILGVA